MFLFYLLQKYNLDKKFNIYTKSITTLNFRVSLSDTSDYPTTVLRTAAMFVLLIVKR